MDRKAQMDRLIWLATTEVVERKRYAWQVAQGLDAAYPGISVELKQRMTGQEVSLVSDGQTPQKLHSVGKK